MKIPRFGKRAFALACLFALVACGSGSPTRVDLDPSGITGRWRFSWTFDQYQSGAPVDCRADVEFEISAASRSLSGVQRGIGEFVCGEERWELQDGRLYVLDFTTRSMRFTATWPFGYHTDATAAITAGYGQVVGSGSWFMPGEEVDLEMVYWPFTVLGVFTAEALP